MGYFFLCTGLVSLPFIPIYCATKSGVLSYTKAVAVRFLLFIISYISTSDGARAWPIKLTWKEKHFPVYKTGLYKTKNNTFRYDDETQIGLKWFMTFLFLKKQAEIAAQGITLSCICPGFTDTAFVQNLEDKMPDFSTAHKAIEHTGLLKYVHGCISHFVLFPYFFKFDSRRKTNNFLFLILELKLWRTVFWNWLKTRKMAAS